MAKKAKKTVKAKKAGTKRKKITAKSVAKKKVAKSKLTKAKKVTAAKASRPAVKVSKPKRKSVAPRKQQAKNLHPGMMGDGTEEQNLNQTGSPGARITQDEIDAAFKKPS
ncbi:MAG: hypothetical protein Q7T14_09375 [Aestuariivirga sp.]|nr:hypothetical protein [Aestuariivirga sp.]